MSKNLEKELIIKDNSANEKLKNMEEDCKLKKSDFIPFFIGQNRYERRTLKYKFASLFAENRQFANSVVEQIDKRDNILESYNLFLISTGIIVGLYYLIS